MPGNWISIMYNPVAWEYILLCMSSDIGIIICKYLCIIIILTIMNLFILIITKKLKMFNHSEKRPFKYNFKNITAL